MGTHITHTSYCTLYTTLSEEDDNHDVIDGYDYYDDDDNDNDDDEIRPNFSTKIKAVSIKVAVSSQHCLHCLILPQYWSLLLRHFLFLPRSALLQTTIV